MWSCHCHFNCAPMPHFSLSRLSSVPSFLSVPLFLSQAIARSLSLSLPSPSPSPPLFLLPSSLPPPPFVGISLSVSFSLSLTLRPLSLLPYVLSLCIPLSHTLHTLSLTLSQALSRSHTRTPCLLLSLSSPLPSTVLPLHTLVTVVGVGEICEQID